MEFRFYIFKKMDFFQLNFLQANLPILGDLYVKDAIGVANNKLSKEVSIEEILQLMNRNNSKMILVADQYDMLHGVVYGHKIFEFPGEYRKVR